MKIYMLSIIFSVVAMSAATAQFSLQLPNMVQSGASLSSSKQAYVYPNPAADFISVANEGEVEKVSIINLLGKTVREFEPAVNGKYPVAELPRGMYMVRIEYQNKTTITVRLNKVNP